MTEEQTAPAVSEAVPEQASAQEAAPAEQNTDQSIPLSRFKKVNERMKKAESSLSELQRQVELQKEEELKAQEKWKEIAELNEKKANDAIETSRRNALKAKLATRSAELGIVDPDVVELLINKESISYLDDGSISGLDQELARIVEAKPYLTKGKSVNIGSGTSPQEPNTGQRFKHSEIKDPVFFQKHKTEILDHMRKGLIQQDL